MAIKFFIELCPPRDAESIPAYCKKFRHLLRHVHGISLASHSTGFVSGFERCYRLAVYLRRLYPNLDMVFHVTCHDIDHSNIDSRLNLLHQLQVRRLLIITGEGYSCSSDPPGCHFKDSYELVKHIIHSYKYFHTVSVAGYPQLDMKQEGARILERIALGVHSIYTQCIFDVKQLALFMESTQNDSRDIQIIPSVAVFSDTRSLERCFSLMKVIPDHQLLSSMQKLDANQHRAFSKDFIIRLCKDIHNMNPEQPIHLCTFNQFQVVGEILDELRDDD